MPDLTTYPYVQQSYTTARDFRDFYDKIAATVQRSTSNLEYGLFKLLDNTTPDKALECLQSDADKIFYKDEQLEKLHFTADNSFWDNWHTIPELSTPYITTSAVTRVSDAERLIVIKSRALHYHLIMQLLACEPEMARDLFTQLKDSQEKLPCDEDSKPLWEQILKLFNIGIQILDVTSQFKEGKADSTLVSSISTQLSELKENFNGKYCYLLLSKKRNNSNHLK